MATINLVQGKFESYLDSGALNNGGTIGIYEPDGTYSTLKTHYNSSSLSTPNANPLTLDSAGRATIYYAGDADIRVRDSLGNIIYSQRNVSPQTVVSVVSLVGNTTIDVSHYAQFIQVSGVGITLTLSDAGILNSGWYTEIVNTNSSNSVTIARATGGDTINGTAANITLLPYQSINIFVNASANGFIVTAKRSHSKGERLESSIWMAEGADVASASDCNIWTTDGNTVHITGTTTITDWGTAPQAGAWKYVIFDDAVPLTYNATTNKLNTNGANYTAVAGDRAIVYAESTSAYNVTIFPIDGSSPIDPTSTTTPVRNSDTTDIPTTEWVREHIGEPSSNLSIWKCGAVNIAQNSTFYLRAVGTTSTTTESSAYSYPGHPTEFYGMKVYLSEAVPSAQTVTVTLRTGAAGALADSSLTTTITGPTSAGAVVPVSGNVYVGRNADGSYKPITVKCVTSATFGNTNDITVSLLARVPDSDYKPVSPFALGTIAGGVGNYSVGGEFSSAVLVNALIGTIFNSGPPIPRRMIAEHVQIINSAGIRTGGGTATSAGYYSAGNEEFCVIEETTDLDFHSYIVFSDRVYGNTVGTWAPIIMSSVSQAQNTTVYMGGYGNGDSATESDVMIPLPAGRAGKIRAYASASAIPAGQSAVITVRKNGVDQALAVTLNDTNRINSNTSDTVTFAENDLVSVKCVSSPTAGTNTYHVVFELDRNA